MTPRVTVLPRTQTPGWYGEDNLWEHTLKFEAQDLDVVCKRQYTTDAMIVMYALPRGAEVKGGKALPRLNKAAMASIAMWDEAVRPVLEVLLVDIDYPNHEVPPDGWAEAQLNKLEKPWRECVGWYRSPHGMRLIFQPPEPIPISKAQSVLDWLHTRLNAMKILTDVGTRDFTRLFRVPHPRKLKDVELPKDLSNLKPMSWDIFLAKQRWDTFEADHLAMRPTGKLPRAEEIAKFVKVPKSHYKPIKDVTLRTVLQGGQLSAIEGERHSTVLSTAIKIAKDTGTKQASEVMRLIYPSKDSINCGASREIDDAELFRICQWAVAQVVSREVALAADRRGAAAMMADKLGVKQSEALKAVILDTGTEFYVWDEHKLEYSWPYTNQRQMLPALSRHAPNLAGYCESQDEALLNHSSPVQRVVKSFERSEPHFDFVTGHLTLPAGRIDPRLIPRENRGVDRWLRGMCPDSFRFEKLLDWLSVLPDCSKGLCALYLEGGPGRGKNLFACGVAGLYGLTGPTEYSLLLDNFSEKLSDCPVIWADETVPKDILREDDAGVFRRTVGSSSRDVNIKYRSPVEVKGQLRMIITANNPDAFTIREALNKDDIAAVKVRLGHIRCPEDIPVGCSLEEVAKAEGFGSVSEMATSWLKNATIAEHILWLAETRTVEHGTRFAVDGWDSEFFESLVTGIGAAGRVGEAVIRAVWKGIQTDAVFWFGGSVYVSTGELQGVWYTLHGHRNTNAPSQKVIDSGVKALADDKKTRIRLPSISGEQKLVRVWQIRAERIAALADKLGFCEKEDILETCAISRSEFEDLRGSHPEAVERRTTPKSPDR